MSTRSGKRIHGSLHEDADKIDLESIMHSERKTRSRKIKDGDENEIEKKRQCYVRYPADEEKNSTNENGDKPRKTRRNTDAVQIEEVKYSRQTRQTKKNADDGLEAKNEAQATNKRKSKKKKNKISQEQNGDVEVIVRKKSNKKKNKKRSSMNFEVVETKQNSSLNRSNASFDSFHSAAGSPVQEYNEDAEVNTQNHNNSRKLSGINTTYDKELNPMSLSNTKRTRTKSSEKIIEDTTTEPKLNSTYEKDSNKRKSSMKSLETHVTKDSEIIYKEQDNIDESELNSTYEKVSQKRKSITKTLDNHDTKGFTNMFDNINEDMNNSISKDSIKRKSGRNSVIENDTTEPKLNGTYDKDTTELKESQDKDDHDTKTTSRTRLRKNLKVKPDNESPILSDNVVTSTQNETKKRKASMLDKDDVEIQNNENEKKIKKRKSSIIILKDVTFEEINSIKLNTTYDKDENNISKSKQSDSQSLNSTYNKSNDSKKLNATFDNEPIQKINDKENKNYTFDKTQENINTTFDKKQEDIISNDSASKSSLISSYATNETFDKSNAHISITSDNSTDLANFTPVLIESSLDESNIKLKENTKSPTTPLKREGTFTKDGPEVIMSPRNKTPLRRKSLPSPGCTPFPISKSSQKDKLLNVTRSIEKKRSSLVEAVPRAPKVMFCSPVNNPAVITQMKGKVIKSNLKGSNKSFVFDDNVSNERSSRKRSYTQSDADEARGKRKRLADDLQHSVDRLSRPRTQSAAAKLTEPSTPSKKTPSKAQPSLSRTKLPNFAALHQKRFDKMESLDECQTRKAKRARQLLTPTGNITVLERSSPIDQPKPAREPSKQATPSKRKLSLEPAKTQKDTKKTETPTKTKLPTLESLNPGYTRFGFRMNVADNPFTIKKDKPTIVKPVKKILSRQTTCLPSLNGQTVRREVAKQTVMREKSFTEKRDVNRKENRTVIKGVRTNRRFELQMKLRNIN